MNDFYTYLTDYKHMLELSEESQTVPEMMTEIALPPKLPTLSNPAPPHTHSLPKPENGQIWLLKSKITLSDYSLPPINEKNEIAAGFHNLIVIRETGEYHLARPEFQKLTVCPISEEILMASSEDLLLESPSLDLLGPCMIEAWNPQSLLFLQLGQYLGQLNSDEIRQLQTLSNSIEMKQPLKDLTIPRGGTIINPHGAHQEFRLLEQKHTSAMSQPFQALQEAQKVIAPFLTEVKGNILKTNQIQSTPPLWLRLPQRKPQNDSKAPLLAASSTLETHSQSSASERDSLWLGENLNLEIWTEGQNLEFYCRHPNGEEIAGLEIEYCDREKKIHNLLSDEFGSCFLPLQTLPLNQMFLFQLHWEGKNYYYPFTYAP